MSTTLIPPIHFEFTPAGRSVRRFLTLAEAAAALAVSAPVEGEMVVVQGGRRRGLVPHEWDELRARLKREGQFLETARGRGRTTAVADQVD